MLWTSANFIHLSVTAAAGNYAQISMRHLHNISVAVFLLPSG